MQEKQCLVSIWEKKYFFFTFCIFKIFINKNFNRSSFFNKKIK